jgi:hypothetical protein
MREFFIALAIGLGAAIIDVVPMLLRKLDKYACISAFIHWMVIGTIIPFIA